MNTSTRSPREGRPVHQKRGVKIVPAVISVASEAVLLPWLLLIPSRFDAALAALGLWLVAWSVGLSVSREFRPMLGMSSAWVACWMCIPAIYQLAHGKAAWGDGSVLQSGHNVTLALALNVVTQSALLIGYGWRLQPRTGDSASLRQRRPKLPEGDFEPRSLAGRRTSRERDSDATSTSAAGARRIRNIGIALVAASVAMLPYVARMKGGLGVLFETRDLQGLAADPALNVAANGGVQATIVEFFPFTFSVAGSLLLIGELHQQGWRHFLLRSRIQLLVGVVMTWFYANPMANTRFIALAMLGSLAFALVWPRSARAGRWIVAAFGTIVLVVYPFSAAFNSSGGLEAGDSISTRGLFGSFATPDFDGFQQTINAFEFVEQHGHSWGHYFISGLLVFVPRSIWSGKATPASIDVAANHGYSFTNLSLATNAELFIDFGFLGVVAAFLIFGRVFARMDYVWKDRASWLPLVAFCSLAQIGIIRGPLGSQMPVVIFTVGTLLFAMAFSDDRPRAANDSRLRAAFCDSAEVEPGASFAREGEE